MKPFCALAFALSYFSPYQQLVRWLSRSHTCVFLFLVSAGRLVQPRTEIINWPARENSLWRWVLIARAAAALCAHAETEEFALSFCARAEPAGIYGVHKYYLLLHSCVSSSAGEDARIRLYVHRSAAFYGIYVAFGSGRNRTSNKITLCSSG